MKVKTEELEPLPEEKLIFYKNIFDKIVPYHKFMGFELLELKKGFAKMLIPYRYEFIGSPNRYHGGVLTSAIDSVSGMASMTTIDISQDKLATLDLRVDYVNPAGKYSIIVEAKVNKSGKRAIFVDTICYPEENPEHILAEGRSVFSVKRFEE